MTGKSKRVFAMSGILFLELTLAMTSQSPTKPTDSGTTLRDFRIAKAAYDAGNLAGAAEMLERLEVKAPKTFEIHELLGLTYAAQALDTRALEQLELAVHLQPGVVTAHTNLATGLVRVGRKEQARAEYEQALKLDPADYRANHSLAGIDLQTNQLAEAIPLLEAAQRARPDAYDNGYDLALAYLLTDNLNGSRSLTAELLKQKDSGELHNLLGRLDEKEGSFVEAANEFEIAAHMDPSEDNLFVWASELLLHRTYVPAIAVFTEATKRYPTSPRLQIGLGMALYSRGEYEPAIKSLLTAADLSPADARCYLFLSKAYLSSPQQAEEVIERFRRYAALEPANAMAQYYYALSLWKGRRLESHEIEYQTVEALLRRSIALDGGFAEAHLQLGILYTDQREFEKSLPEYQAALAVNPNLADAHFRLGRYYLHAGDKGKAQDQFDIFKKLQTQHQAEEDKARAEVQQFIVSSASTSPSQ